MRAPYHIHVIANQSADWCGNPVDLQNSPENPGDSHATAPAGAVRSATAALQRLLARSCGALARNDILFCYSVNIPAFLARDR